MNNMIEIITRLAKTISVIYAEDEPEVRASTAELISNFFPNLKVTQNGLEAFELWQKERSELIITDVRMPKMDGVDLLRKVHEIYPEQRVVVISAFSDAPLLINLINQGASGFILKPIQVNQFLEILLKELKTIHQLRDEATLQSSMMQEIEQRTQVLNQTTKTVVALTQARDTMLRLVAHELRTPINAINGFLHLLKIKIGSNPEFNEIFETLFLSVQRLESSTQKSLDLIHIKSSLEVRRDWLPLAEFFEEEFQANIKKNFSGTIEILANRTFFKFAIKNIQENCRKYGKPPFDVVMTLDEEHLSLQIQDNGSGFNSTILRHYEKDAFSSGDIFHHHEGLGLGLAIINESLIQSGFGLKLSNKDSGGAITTIIIPKEMIRIISS